MIGLILVLILSLLVWLMCKGYLSESTLENTALDQIDVDYRDRARDTKRVRLSLNDDEEKIVRNWMTSFSGVHFPDFNSYAPGIEVTIDQERYDINFQKYRTIIVYATDPSLPPNQSFHYQFSRRATEEDQQLKQLLMRKKDSSQQIPMPEGPESFQDAPETPIPSTSDEKPPVCRPN